MKQTIVILALLFSLVPEGFSQELSPPKPLDISVRKVGPYFGYELGQTHIIEFGSELMFKTISLRKASVHGLHFGFNYGWEEPAMGFETGYWYKQGSLNMSFGASLVVRTNFDETRYGVSPMIGYRLFGFHLQAGYHFLTPAVEFTNTNTFFIRLRFTLVTDRKWDIDGLNFDRKKKKERKKD